VYSPDGIAKLYGNRWATVIMELALKYDRMQSEATKLSGKRLHSHKKMMVNVRKRIHNLKIDLRHKIAADLVHSADAVLLPKLEVKNLVMKGERRLTTKTARILLAAGHGMFFQHVQFKCLEHGVHFLQVPEQYTSCTCPACGERKKCDEVFKCTSCGFTVGSVESVGHLAAGAA
jgi:putative transposase